MGGGGEPIKIIRNFISFGGYTHLWYLNATIISLLLLIVFFRINLKLKSIFIISLILYFLGANINKVEEALVVVQNYEKIWLVVDNVTFFITKSSFWFGLILFVIGMILSKVKIDISFKNTVILFLISMFCLAIEVFIITFLKIDLRKDKCFFSYSSC